MSYDEGPLTFLPWSNIVLGTGNVTLFALDSPVGTKMNRAYTALAAGRLHSVFYHAMFGVASSTLNARMGVLVNDAVVATFEIPHGLAAGGKRHAFLSPVAGKSFYFDTDDQVEVALERVGTDATLYTGAIGVRLGVRLHGST